MTEEELKARLRAFALRIMTLCDALPNTKSGRTIAEQLVRSGTSPGANYRAACRGRSLADFVAKLAICEEEMDESGYWLDLIMARGLFPAARIMPLYQESDQLTRILSASRITAKVNGAQKMRSSPKIENRKSKIENPKGDGV
jgi:four helix bundle protein